MKLIASIFAIVALTAVTAQACPPQLLGQCYSQRVVQRQQLVQKVYAQPVIQQVYAAPIVQQQVVEYVQPQVAYVQQQAVVQRVVQKDKVRLRLRSPIVRQRVQVQRLAY